MTAAAGFLYFLRDKPILSGDNALYQAIPVSSPFFFEFNSLKSIPFENKALDELSDASVWPHFFRYSQKLDTLIENNSELSKKLRRSPFVLSFGFTGRDELVPLVIAKARESNRQAALENLLKMAWPPESFSYNSKEYGKYTITEINNAVNEEPVFWSFADGFLLVSTKSILIEQSIRQLLADGIDRNPYFSLVSRAANSQSGFSLFLNHRFFSDFVRQLVSNKTENSTDEFGETKRVNARREIEAFRNFAAWSELGFRFNEDHLLISGISAADDSLNHFLSVFADQQPVRFQAEDILPQNTSFFCNYSFNNKEAFFERLEEYFALSEGYYRREERMKRFDRGFRSNTRNVFQNLVKEEVIVAATTIPVDPKDKNVFFILHTRSRSEAEEQLKKMLDNYAVRSATDPEKLRSDFQVDNEVHFPVYRFPYPSFPGIWMGSPFSMIEARFVTFYDNYMVFANSEQGLHEYLRNMVLGTTLSKDMYYQQFRKNSSSRANMNVFVDVNKAYGLRNELFTNSLLGQMEDREESIRKFGMVNWQVQRERDIFFNSVAVAFQAEVRDEARTTWQSAVGNNVTLKPQLVVNHNDAGNHEIIMQDNQHQLSLVTAAGRVRWSIPLSGPVLGEIHQVDYYKNGKLQYLFNTKEKLYLIDRNGNNVAHFPVTLRSPATNAVSVFDYDNNRNYRYFVAGEDKKVYAYDYSGKIIQGWKFDQTDHPVTTPVQHFRVAGKDYIVFKDKSRIYIQNRQGETRVPTKARFENSGNPLTLNLDGRPKIVATDTGGNVYYLYFNGEFEEKKTARFSENHFFTVDDLDGDNVPDFIFVDGNEVTVMKENGRKMFSKKLDNQLKHPPHIYTFSAGLKKVGVVDETANRIYLFNPDGKLHEGFPLQGNSEFSIGKLSGSDAGLSLIVGSEGGKLYNYTLN